METNLLIDADIPAYAIASRCESVFDFGGDDEGLAVALRPEEIGPMVEEVVNEYADKCGANRVYVCLSAPDGAYFRKELDPTYKSNRVSSRKPELLQAVKNYMAQEYTYYVRPRLEADDVMGILATHPKLLPGVNVMCSADKDMRTIPGKLFNPNKEDLGIIDITVDDANRFLLWQAIVGDPTDGYPGCPGVGEGGEWKDNQFVQGPKGVDWCYDLLAAEGPLEQWNVVLDAYASKGLTEADAIHQVRLARILRSCDYNYKTHKVKLWDPLKLFWDV